MFMNGYINMSKITRHCEYFINPMNVFIVLYRYGLLRYKNCVQII